MASSSKMPALGLAATVITKWKKPFATNYAMTIRVIANN